MRFFVLLFIVLQITSLCSSASSITFTAKNGDWIPSANWDMGTPTSVDDVIIPQASTATITTSIAYFNTLTIFGKVIIQIDQSFEGIIYISSGGILEIKGMNSNIIGGGSVELHEGMVKISDISTIDLPIYGYGGTLNIESKSKVKNLQLLEGETTVFGSSDIAVDLLNISTTANLGSTIEYNNANVSVNNLYWNFGSISQTIQVLDKAVLDVDFHLIDQGEFILNTKAKLTWKNGAIEVTNGSTISILGEIYCEEGENTCMFNGDADESKPIFNFKGKINSTQANYVEQAGSAYFYGFDIISSGTWIGGIFSSSKTNWNIEFGSTFDFNYPITLIGLPTDFFNVTSAVNFGSFNAKGHSVVLNEKCNFKDLNLDSSLNHLNDLNIDNLIVTGTITTSPDQNIYIADFFRIVSGTFINSQVNFGVNSTGTLEGTSRWTQNSIVNNEGNWLWNSSGYVLISNDSKITNNGNVQFSSSESLIFKPDIENYGGGEFINHQKMQILSTPAFSSIVFDDSVPFLQCDGILEFKIEKNLYPSKIHLSGSSSISYGKIVINTASLQSIPKNGYTLFEIDSNFSNYYIEASNPSPVVLAPALTYTLCLDNLGDVDLYLIQNAPSTGKCGFHFFDKSPSCPSLRSQSSPMLLPISSLYVMLLIFFNVII